LLRLSICSPEWTPKDFVQIAEAIENLAVSFYQNAISHLDNKVRSIRFSNRTLAHILSPL